MTTETLTTDPYADCPSVISVLRAMADPAGVLYSEDLGRAAEYLIMRSDLPSMASCGTIGQVRKKIRDSLANDNRHFQRRRDGSWTYIADRLDKPPLHQGKARPPTTNVAPLVDGKCGRCGGSVSEQTYFTESGHTGKARVCRM